MKFVGVRDFRSGTARIWKDLEKEKEFVITSNGKPVALLTAVNEDNFESAFKNLRRARAMAAVEALHKHSLRSGLDRMPLVEIAQEIKKARDSR